MLAFYPILSGYGLSPQIDFGVFAAFIVGVLCIITRKERFKPTFPPGYVLFFGIALIFAIVIANSLPMRLLLFSVNLCIACSFADFKLLYKYYGILVFVCCTFFLFQEIAAFSIGINISGLVSFIPTIYESMGTNQISVQESLTEHSSLFLEKSYFAQYLFPFIVLKLFSGKKDDLKKAIMISFIVVLSRSGNGIVLLLIIWSCWFFMGRIRLKYKMGMIIFAVLAILLMMRIDSTIIENILGRAIELQSYGGDERFQSSGFIRFFRGYYAYADMPTFNKLFGANPFFVQSIIQSNYFFSDSDDRFLNGTQTLLMHHGAIVCFLFFRHLYQMYWQCKKKEILVLFFCCVWLMFGESYFLCARMFMTIVLMYVMIISDKKVSQIKPKYQVIK